MAGCSSVPEALIDDGLLDLTVLPALAEERRLDVLSALVSEGRAAIEREVTTLRVAWAELEATERICVNLDGEPMHGHHLRIEVQPAALRLRLPAGTPLLTP